jgi:hypothetical protein
MVKNQLIIAKIKRETCSFKIKFQRVRLFFEHKEWNTYLFLFIKRIYLTFLESSIIFFELK